MKRIAKHIPHMLVVSAFLIAGLLIGGFTRILNRFQLEPKISLDELFNFISGVIVALLIGSIWQKYYGASRAESEILVQRIRVLQEKLAASFETFYRIVQAETMELGGAQRAQVKELFNTLIVQLETAKRSLVHLTTELASLKCMDKSAKDNLEMELILYRQALTLKDYDQRYDSHDVSRAYRHFDQLNDSLFSLIVSVNSR